MLVPRNAFISLLEKEQCNKYGILHGHEIWVTPKKFIIRVPLEHNIHCDLLEPVFMDTLGMSMWEYDYWLGQHMLN